MSISVSDGSVSTIVASANEQYMPSWAAKVPKLVYVTNRSGAQEIWSRDADGSEQAVVTAANFQSGSTKWLLNPALSPDGDRVVFQRHEIHGELRIWVRMLPFGSPVMLTESPKESDGLGGAWSPRGDQVAFLKGDGDSVSLAIATVGLRTPAVRLFPRAGVCVPEWSPDGNWITLCTDEGWKIVSPKTRQVRSLGKIDTPHLAFSKDSKRVYGIRGDEDHQYFFYLDLATLKMKTIRELRREDWPQSGWIPERRLSMAPDGKTATYAAGVPKSNLWMLKGFNPPSLFQRLRFAR